MTIGHLQRAVTEWAERCFGRAHTRDPKVRALRLLEESLELAQAVGVNREKCIELAGFVYNRPPGHPVQELGGIAICALAAAAALKVDFQDALEKEWYRIKAKPDSHFTARNQSKCEAGFQ